MFARVAAAHDVALAAHHDFDPYYGRRLEGDLAAAGLFGIGSDGRVSVWRAGRRHLAVVAAAAA